MSPRSLISVAVSVIAAVVLCAGGIGGFLFGGSGSGVACTTPTGASPAPSLSTPPPGGTWPPFGTWDSEQVGHAATIVAVGRGRGVPLRGWVIALATAMQESGLRNPSGGPDDSIGLFQQRPSQGWGTPAQLADPAYAAGKFYDALLAVPNWQTMAVTDAAQAVQKSAYPDAYAKWEADAALVFAFVGSSGSWAIPGDLEQCLSNCPAIMSATASGGPSAAASAVACEWVAPVRAPVVSGFRTAQRPTHNGVDLGAARGTPIQAASAGTVVVVRCNVVPASHGCDRDGSPSTPGCGWYVDVRHAGGVYTRYCHMLTRPAVVEGQAVAVGQVIGVVGSSGHSSGPHLHFEVHVGSRSEGAVDPVVFMAGRGVRLGDP